MFTTVAKNFFKFLAAYFCLLVAFALRKHLTTEFKQAPTGHGSDSSSSK